MSTELIKRLHSCPKGQRGWKDFEDICIKILCYLFVPPLSEPKIQKRTYSGINVRDAVFPNRNFNSSNIWGQLLKELDARLILFDFKNYDKKYIGKEEVNQVSNYLTKPMGRLTIICCSKPPSKAAYRRRNTIFSSEGKVILFLTIKNLKEMIFRKDRGEDPADLIMDMIEEFYLQHE
ncbi:MAG: hypothetical protein QW270_00965 [Candidatus Bathyarchaeia archaeon]